MSTRASSEYLRARIRQTPLANWEECANTGVGTCRIVALVVRRAFELRSWTLHQDASGEPVDSDTVADTMSRFGMNRRHVTLITQGKYSVWFKTPVGEGAGMVEFAPDGKLSGGDSTFCYEGNWTQEGERFRATLSAKRTVPGPPDVFGLDEIDIVVTGKSDEGTSVSCKGFAKQAPGLKLEVVLIRAEKL